MEDKKPGANEKAGDLTRKSRTSVSEVSLYRRLRRCDETNGVADMAVKAFFFQNFSDFSHHRGCQMLYWRRQVF